MLHYQAEEGTSFFVLFSVNSHQIRNLEYSTTGDVILVVAANAQAKVIDRDGFEKCECVKGDQYLVDPASTKVRLRSLLCQCHSPFLKSGLSCCVYFLVFCA